MHLSLRLLAGCLLLLGLGAGCSTPGTRARQHSEAFHRLLPADQALVLNGHVRRGLSREGVYIAWGEPDAKTTGADGKNGSGVETWIYRQRVTLPEPMNSYDYFGPYHGYVDQQSERWLRPGYGAGGIGNEGALQYQPHTRNLDTLRIAVFSAGKVDRYKTAGGEWTQRTPAVTPTTARSPHPTRHSASAKTVKPSRVRTGKSVRSRSRQHRTAVAAARRLHQSGKANLHTTHRAQKHGHRKSFIHAATAHHAQTSHVTSAKHVKPVHGKPAQAKQRRTAAS